MTEHQEPTILGHRTCWFCHRATHILWDSHQDRAYCPLCLYTQPARRHPNTQLQRLAWTHLRVRYAKLEGVSLDEQRGVHR